LWFGYAGDLSRFSPAAREAVDAELRNRRFRPLRLSSEELAGYYVKFSNGVLWPLFHYLLDRIPQDPIDWHMYERVNARFADALAHEIEPGDLVWIHDYHLGLVPSMLRKLVPGVRVGFFLHVPFPSSEVFRLFPWRAEWLEGVLGSDVIGFHTLAYQRHFGRSVRRILGLEIDFNRVWVDGREVLLESLPMGVDAQYFGALASRAAKRPPEDGAKVLLGVDRLDYTKGIPRRLHAYEVLLARSPALHGRVRLVQVASPSRGEVPEYERYKRQVDEIVGRINGRFGTAGWTPIHYLTRALKQEDLIALYCEAHVMLVTPLRDGMNLVAKEYIASRVDEDGVLVLSEFAGAVSELSGAVIVNPYDIEGLARAIELALEMPAAERARRMQLLRERVCSWTVHVWVSRFLADLQRETGAKGRPEPVRAPTVLAAAESNDHPWVLILDYDGTLVPFADHPRLAAPDPELLSLLAALNVLANTSVHVVSGRTPTILEEWLQGTGAALHAEHGLWTREPREGWERQGTAESQIPEAAVRLLEDTAERISGCFLETKTSGVVLHYRLADRTAVEDLFMELRLHLQELLSNAPVQVVAGMASLELRPAGVGKGDIVRRIRARDPDATLLVIGDDRTDEDMFSAVSAPAFTFHVGPGPTRAEGRLGDWRAVRRLLEGLLERRSALATRPEQT